MDVVGSKEKLIAKIGCHPSEFAVNEVQGADKIRRRNADESKNHFFLRLAASEGVDLCIQGSNEFTIGGIGDVKISNDLFSADP